MTSNAQSLDRFLSDVERRAYGMAMLAVGQREEALDIVQDAMMKFANSYALKPQEQWRPLFYRVLQNQIRDWQRRTIVRSRWRVWLGSNRQGEDFDSDPVQSLADPAGRDPLSQLRENVAMEKLQVALAKLPARQQEVFLLRVWEGLDVAQTAKAMSVSQGSVKTHYSRAVHSLRDQLEGHWP